MSGRNLSLLGVFAPVLAYVFIGLSILQSPWFGWEKNALSDLGHALRSSVASLYNFGLLLTGLLLALFSVLSLRRYAAWTSVSLLITALALQLVAMFDEVYGRLHFVVSVLFFVSMGLTSIVFGVEKRSLLAVSGFIVGLASWLLHWARIFTWGVAVPEAISTIAAFPWLMLAAYRMHREE